MTMTKNNRGLYVVLTGAPGCGKGTQARILQERTGICHLSTGEMLREYAKKDTPLGKELKATLDRGEFATDELIIEMVKNRIGEDDCKKGFILTGFRARCRKPKFWKVCWLKKGLSLLAF